MTEILLKYPTFLCDFFVFSWANNYFDFFKVCSVRNKTLLNTQCLTNSTLVYPFKMEYGWNLWLKVSFIVGTFITKPFIKIPPWANKVICINEFVILCKSPPFYEVKWMKRKWLAHGGISKYFFFTTFHRHFSAKNVNFRYIFHFDQVNQSWVCHILCVNLKSEKNICFKI